MSSQQHHPQLGDVQVPLSMGEDGCGVACCASGCSPRISGEGGCDPHRSPSVATVPKGLGYIMAYLYHGIPYTVLYRMAIGSGNLIRFKIWSSHGRKPPISGSIEGSRCVLDMLPFFLKVEACLSVDVLQVISYQILYLKRNTPF